jgi:hypothetical protein
VPFCIEKINKLKIRYLEKKGGILKAQTKCNLVFSPMKHLVLAVYFSHPKFCFEFQILTLFIHSHNTCYENYITGEYFNTYVLIFTLNINNKAKER